MAKKIRNEQDYKVGYGKPPKEHQIQPGEIRNHTGRPQGSKNFSTMVRKILDSKVPITKNGKKKTVSTQEAMLLRLTEKALAGDQRALQKLLDLAERYGEQAEAEAEERKLSANEQAILDDFLDRQKADWEHERKAAEDAADKDDNPSYDDDEAWLR